MIKYIRITAMALLLLATMSFAQVNVEQPTTTEGCWVVIYEDTNYNDKQLKLEGPAQYANMRGLPNSNGEDWGDSMGSVRTGPRCWVVGYADENYGDTSIIIGPNSELTDLGDMEDEIDSIKILDHAP